ncbi:MAG TPA: helix-turn-helix domain-containing protein [Terriglobales bacterium]
MRDTVAVRNGRRANFFITENRFIDCYAAKVGGSGVAVYSILQRCANSETRETWISADKMAEILDMDRSTVYRQLKQLENFRLIRSMRTGGRTIYVVLPVPPPPREATSTPLFDAIDSKSTEGHFVWSPVAPERASCADEIGLHAYDISVASAQPSVASAQQFGRADEKCNKEEQDPLNKTQNQDSFSKIFGPTTTEVQEAAQRVLNIFPGTRRNAAVAAVEIEVKESGLSTEAVVEEIWKKATRADRKHVPRERFFDEYLSKRLAERVLDMINLPATHNAVTTVMASLRAEARDRETSLEETAGAVVAAAIDDRRKGVMIDRFYFENCKWRANGRVSKSEQRKLDNLEVNARVKQRFREKLGVSRVD